DHTQAEMRVGDGRLVLGGGMRQVALEAFLSAVEALSRESGHAADLVEGVPVVGLGLEGRLQDLGGRVPFLLALVEAGEEDARARIGRRLLDRVLDLPLGGGEILLVYVDR